MANWKELEEFSNLLKWVAVAHRKERGVHTNKHDSKLLGDVAIRFNEMTDVKLQERLPSTKSPAANLVGDRQHILLRQLKYDNVTIQPVLTLSSVIERKHFKLAVYVALGYYPKNSAPTNQNLRFIGYRFESPEGKGGGEHDFFHAQHVCSFSRVGGAVPLNHEPSELAWLPEEQPSFALSANCLVTFGMNIFATLYGGNFIKELADAKVVEPHRMKSFRDHALNFSKSCVGEDIEPARP